MSAAVTRRAALQGSMAASLGLAAGAAPVLAAPVAVNPDLALIEFARRVERLARLHDRACNRMMDVEASLEEWSFANKPRAPNYPEVPAEVVIKNYKTSTHRVTCIEERLETSPTQTAYNAVKCEYEAALESHRLAVETRKAASRLPYLTKVADRMWFRLTRYVERLTNMRPTSAAGLAAKASVLVTLAETEVDVADWWGHNLVRSVAHDAVRLGRGDAA